MTDTFGDSCADDDGRVRLVIPHPSHLVLLLTGILP
jgi:hypothetical protein